MQQAYNPWRHSRGTGAEGWLKAQDGGLAARPTGARLATREAGCQPALGLREAMAKRPAGAQQSSRGRKPPVCIARKSKPRRGDTVHATLCRPYGALNQSFAGDPVLTHWATI